MQSLQDADRDKLDQIFERMFEIYKPANKMGIDRVFIHPDTRFRFTVEYKIDYGANKSGHCYLPTWEISPDESHTGKRGWSYGSLAQVVIYYIPGREVILFLSGNSIKHYVIKWEKEETYPITKFAHDGYESQGLRVPIEKMGEIAYTRIAL